MRRLALPLAFALLSLGFAPAPLPKAPPKGRGETRGETKTAKEVMHWLIEETGKGAVGRTPGGTITFPWPKGTRYSASDVFAVLNNHLLPRGLALIEREWCFILIPAEDLPQWR
jgi:hypothetical protein